MRVCVCFLLSFEVTAWSWSASRDVHALCDIFRDFAVIFQRIFVDSVTIINISIVGCEGKSNVGVVCFEVIIIVIVNVWRFSRSCCFWRCSKCCLLKVFDFNGKVLLFGPARTTGAAFASQEIFELSKISRFWRSCDWRLSRLAGEVDLARDGR